MDRITVDLISSKEFSIESKGYNKKEVDEFLDDICDEMERMEAEIKDLKQKTVSVRETPAAPAAPAVTQQDTNSFKEILEMAQKVKDETIRKAKEDAEAIRARAEAEATDRLDGLNEEKDQLTRQVSALKTAAADYRTKFEQLLQAQQEALEKASDLF